jgi:multicomponent Na+:H+ antiporter subunit B
MNNKGTGMSLIVKTVTRLTVGLIFIYGIYIALHGHIKPGGGFAGGLILALSFIHIFLAFGKDAALKKLGRKAVLSLMGLSAVIFLFVLIFGISEGSYALSRKIMKSLVFKAIPVSDVAACVIFGMGLFAMFLALTLINENGDED